MSRATRKDKRRIVRLRDLVPAERRRRIDEQVTPMRLDRAIKAIDGIEQVRHVGRRFITGQQHAAPAQPRPDFRLDTSPLLIPMRVESSLQFLEGTRARWPRILVGSVMISHTEKILRFPD